MSEAHRGMEIGGAEYAAAAGDILNTTKAPTYDAETRAEVAATLRTLKPEITYA